MRFFYWQIVHGDTLRLQAASQYALTLTLPAQRGSIFAADGHPLVMNESAFDLYGEPKKISDIAKFSEVIGLVTQKEPKDIASALTTPGRVWVPLARRVNETTVNAIQSQHLEGIAFEKDPIRYYPEASMAAHVLGFVGSDQQGSDKGYFGLEGYYDRELRGKDGLLQREKDAHGAPILIGESKRIEPENGRTLSLWLDRSIQFRVEERLKEGIKKYGAKAGSVVVMDPRTGGIVAMASYPSYDSGHFFSFDGSLYKNPIVASSYEPGSTFKTLIMSAGLNEHVITPSTAIEETGPVKIGEYQIRTWDDQYHGVTTMTKVLEHSSNVGMVYVSRQLGSERMLRYIKNFGFGEPTGIDLEEESSPELRRDRDWREIDFATASFGQGIAVTPIQMVRGVAALANDGWIMEPHVVREVQNADGRVLTVKPKKIRQVISSSAAKVITEMMVASVDNGEAKWAKPEGYRIAGKTGTAQIPVAGHYDDKKTIASFVGFAPADNPRFVMLVTLQEPTSSPWGSETAAPLFFAIARELFLYWGIPPSSYSLK